MTFREIVDNCPSRELFSFVWRCWGWGVAAILVPFVLLAAIIELFVDPSASLAAIVYIALVLPIAFFQGMIAGLIIIAGRGVYRTWIVKRD